MVRSLAVLLSIASVSVAHAETVTLIDGTKLVGEVVHVYQGEFAVKTGHGEVVLDRAKIKSISFEVPPARAIYSTPEKTLDAWRAAAANGDEKGMVDAYALVFQGTVAQEMGAMGFKDKSQMIRDVSDTTFTVKSRKVEKTSAVLTVEQAKGEESRSGDIKFVLENGEWKMTP